MDEALVVRKRHKAHVSGQWVARQTRATCHPTNYLELFDLLSDGREKQPERSVAVDHAMIAPVHVVREHGHSHQLSPPGGSVCWQGMSTRALGYRAASAPAMVLFSALVAAIIAEAMYRLSPTYAAALLLGPILLGVIISRPTIGIYASLLAIPLESAGTSSPVPTSRPQRVYWC